MRFNSVLLIMALSLTFTPLALAQAPTPAHPPPAGAAPAAPGGAAPTRQKLSEPQVVHALKEQGFTDIRTVGRKGDILQMQATRNGKPVQMVVNTVTGRIAVRPR